MHVPKSFDTSLPPSLCINCGIPLDSQYFDESGVAEEPDPDPNKEILHPGEHAILARFTLPPQYCGVLEYFSQFSDQHADHPSRIKTPGLEWMILSNNRPLYPYIKLDRIVNPWGYGSFPIAIRLDENSTVEFVVRRVRSGVTDNGDVIRRVGGRIVGRYWYNAAYGG